MTPLPFVMVAVSFVTRSVTGNLLSSRQALRSTSRSDGHGQTDAEVMEKVTGFLAEDMADLNQMISSQEDIIAPSTMRPAVRHDTFPAVGLELRRVEACPLGYSAAAGDVPGGDFFGRSFDHKADTIDNCAVDCSGRAACLSFEYSPTSKHCYLNKASVPSAAAIGDTLLCIKASVAKAAATGSNTTVGNTTAATTVAANTSHRGLITFHGRLGRFAGFTIWSFIGMVLLLMMFCFCWLFCCGLLAFFSGGQPDNVEPDEDRELHEVWVRKK